MRKKPKIKFKKLLSAFGGVALYIDRQMLEHLNLQSGEEIQIELKEHEIVLSKPFITNIEVDELLQKEKSRINERS